MSKLGFRENLLHGPLFSHFMEQFWSANHHFGIALSFRVTSVHPSEIHILESYCHHAPCLHALCPKRHQFAGERSVQFEYVGVEYSDPSASVLSGRSEMVETMAGEALCTNQSSLTVGKSLHFQVLV